MIQSAGEKTAQKFQNSKVPDYSEMLIFYELGHQPIFFFKAEFKCRNFLEI